MMKLSVEGKVAASIAAAFVGLTVGVIAQGNSAELGAGPNGYDPTSDLEVTTHRSEHGYDSSLGSRTNAEENRDRTHWELRDRL